MCVPDSYPVVVMRGGTSRALVFRAADLPADEAEQDAVFLAAMGSPDPSGRQTDGLGGGHPLTSKVAVVGASSSADADVDYTFAQVDVRRALVDRRGNCGNISSAVGPFAIAEGLVEVDGETRAVRIRNTNTNKLIYCHMSGEVLLGTQHPMTLEFLDPGGSITGSVLPTGRPIDVLSIGGVSLEVSIVDAGNTFVFVRMADVGVTADRAVDTMDADVELLARLEAIRVAAAVACGLASSVADVSPAIPKLALVGPPASNGDLCVRSLSMGRIHGAYQLTGGVCTAVAAGIPGTVVAAAYGAGAQSAHLALELEHPSGTMRMDVHRVTRPDGDVVVDRVGVRRTARRVMAGTVFTGRGGLVEGGV